MKRIASNDATLKESKKKKISNNGEQNLGKIESIALKNFMCHENFEFQFGPRLNFIIGENGSGKSAILTAMILVLGGASKNTDRFSKIQDFIMRKKQKAKIELVLNNCGETAYRPESYGKKIIVTREFTVSGSNQYKLISETGNVVATSKEELSNVLMALDIHVENPVQVLTQERSRTSLFFSETSKTSKRSKENKLYEFFYQGTNLKALEDSYNSVKLTKNEAERTLETKIEALAEMKKELDQWKRFLDSSTTIENYTKDLVWAGIIEMENIIKTKEEECANIENELKINKEEVEKCEVLLDNKVKKLDECTEKRTECNIILPEYQNKVQKLKSDYKTCISSLRKHEGLLDMYKREEEKITNDIQILKNQINENLQKTQVDVTENEKSLQLENQDASHNLDQLQKSKSLIMATHEQTMKKIENLNAEIKGLDYVKREIMENINHVKMALENRTNVFGPFTQNVLGEISARKNEFKKLPVGPIGMYIEVKDPKWIPAIEECLSSSLLCSYCVDNTEDELVLENIMHNHCDVMPSTIVCPYSDEVYDVSEYKAQSNYPTVLDMLNFNDVQVANALIDQAQIENKILIEDTRTGQSLMVSNPPRNCKGAFILNCDHIFLDPYRYYSQTNPNRNSLISDLQKDKLTKLNEHLNQLVSESNTKIEQKCEFERQVETFPSKIKDLDSQIVHFSMLQSNTSQKLQDLMSVKNAEDVNYLKEELRSLEEEHEMKRTKIEESEREVTKCKQEKEHIIRESEEAKKLLFAKKEEHNALTTEIKQCSQEKEKLTDASNCFRDKVKACEKKLHLLKKELKSEKQKTELATQDAETICARIETENDYHTIQRMLTETQKVVEKLSKCNRIELNQKYLEKLHKCREAENDLRKFRSYLTKLDAMLALRYIKLKDILVHTRTVIVVAFIALLHENNFTGSLIFDDSKQTLNLEAAPKTAQRAKQKHCLLSGGERSLVTILFLLALWERTRMPFRVFDEYDVFMDSNNRQLSSELLIRKAEQMESTQFIFLSPLDIPPIKHPENVKIYRLPPPKRPDNNLSP